MISNKNERILGRAKAATTGKWADMGFSPGKAFREDLEVQ
jgi:hypothetical protein